MKCAFMAFVLRFYKTLEKISTFQNIFLDFHESLVYYLFNI